MRPGILDEAFCWLGVLVLALCDFVVPVAVWWMR
jgi:hypothetical protein